MYIYIYTYPDVYTRGQVTEEYGWVKGHPRKYHE